MITFVTDDIGAPQQISKIIGTMIERISISNYKSIKYAEIDLKMINILIGPNGAGKSNFISFFELT